MDRLQLVAFELYGSEKWDVQQESGPIKQPIRSQPTRMWMDEIPHKAGYRCLPLTMANNSGWWVLCPTDVTVLWKGGHELSSLSVESSDPWFTERDGSFSVISSHFGSGILTFALPWLFRTDVEGIGLRVEGPPNLWIEGLFPLTGMVETWINSHVSTFTMNWKVVAKNTRITIPKGFPICHLSPYDFRLNQNIDPVVGPKTLMNDKLYEDFLLWSGCRQALLDNTEPPLGFSDQRLSYSRHIRPDKTEYDSAHWTKQLLPNFTVIRPYEFEDGVTDNILKKE